MKIQIEVKREDIEDVIISALEGASNYWYFLPDLTMLKVHPENPQSRSQRICNAVFDGKTIPIHDLEEWAECEAGEESASFLGNLSLENIARGLSLYFQSGNVTDFENMDDGDYDDIFQYIVMGEVVYG